MHRRDRGLDRVRSRASAGERALDQLRAVGDLLAVPERPVLVGQQDELSRRRGARRAPGFLQQHEGEQAHGLGLRQQLDQQAPEPNRLARQVVARERLARRREVALVEDEVDDAQHAVEPLGELAAPRHLVGNARIADLAFRPHDALRHGRGRAEVRACDLLGGHAADLAQREGDLRVGRERRVAAGEDEPQPIVLDALVLARRARVGDRLDLLGDVVEWHVEACAPANPVDRLEPPRRNQPRARVGRDAVARPLLDRGGERVVQGLLRDVEIAEQADERRQHATRFGAVDGFDGGERGGHRRADSSAPL
jgi:hypothetical protein